jgi:hypothetical protein
VWYSPADTDAQLVAVPICVGLNLARVVLSPSEPNEL